MIFTIELVLFALYCTIYVYHVYYAIGRRRLITEIALHTIFSASVMIYVLGLAEDGLEPFFSFLLVIALFIMHVFPHTIDFKTLET